MDRHIQELVSSKSYRQALKQVRTKLKRSPNNVPLLISEAQIHLASGDHEECQKLCLVLCEAKPPITQLEHVAAIYTILCKLKLLDAYLDIAKSHTLWKNAVNRSGDRAVKVQVVEEWASLSIEYQQWAQVAAASTSLGLYAPENKQKYYFWRVTAHFLASRLPSVNKSGAVSNGKLEEVNGSLARNYLHTAVANVGVAEMRESIRTPAELKLYALVHARMDTYHTVIKTFSLESMKQVAKQDQDMNRLELEMVQGTNQASKVWEVALQILSLARENGPWYRGQDWFFWENLVMPLAQCAGAGEKLDAMFDSDDISVETATMDLIGASRNLKIPCRALELAIIILGHQPKQTLAINYFQLFAAKPFVCADLKDLIVQLSLKEFLETQHSIGAYVKQTNIKNSNIPDESASRAQMVWISSEINALKIDLTYLTSLSIKPGQMAGKVVELLKMFVCNCLRLYKVARTHTLVLSKTAIDPGDEACMLAVRGLFYISSGHWPGDESRARVKLICLLQFLVSEAPHNSSARLELIKQARRFGLMSLAWSAYEGLRAKKVLHEPLCPIFFNRIGAIHPITTKALDAYAAMGTPLRFYAESVDDVAKYQELALEHGNYEQVVHMQQFRDRLRWSTTRVMLAFERRRIARLTSRPYDNDEPLLEHFNAVSFLQALSSDIPDIAQGDLREYLHFLIGLDASYEIATSSLPEQNDVYGKRLPDFEQVWRYSKAKTTTPMENSLEQRIFNLSTILVLIVGEMFRAGTGSGGTIPTGISPNAKVELKHIESSLGTLAENLQRLFQIIEGSLGDYGLFLPLAEWYQYVFMSIDLCRVCHKFAEKTAAFLQQKWKSKNNVRVLTVQGLAGRHFNAIKLITIKRKQELAPFQNGGSLVNNVLRPSQDLASEAGEAQEVDCMEHEIYNLMGHHKAKKLMSEMAVSAMEALDGILSAKLV